MATRLASGEGWTLIKVPRRATRARRGAAATAAASADMPAAFLQSDAVRVEDVVAAVPRAGTARRSAAPPDLLLEVDLKPGEAVLLAVRHPSGALTFHRTSARVARAARRGASASSAAAQFRIAVRRIGGLRDEAGGRGLMDNALKIIVLAVAKPAIDQAVSVALPKLAAFWEKRTWTKRQLAEGWFQITPVPGTTPGLRLAAAVPRPGQRTLLLMHGIFSHAAGAFGPLAATEFFARARALYGDRIYAFNHFSVSRTPEDNASDLLQRLPAAECLFDVVAHSRGGLVLRSLVERAAQHGALARRFTLGHAILVASPNDGTPLATPSRWDETIGWFANMMEVFPDNPFTTGAEFVSEALVWLAAHLSGDLPGLRAMDGAGRLVAELQSPPGPPADAYSALVSNFHPDEALWERALDVGVDHFFGGANDLVVPSEGGWRVDRDGSGHIDPRRIGCFGPGGNIDAGSDSVNHINFFGRSETADFLSTALAGEAHGLRTIDPQRPLPDRRFKRGMAGGEVSTSEAAEIAESSADAATARSAAGAGEWARRRDTDTFHIVVMDAVDQSQGGGVAKQTPRFARVLASYGGARVMATMRLRAAKGEAPSRFGQIIAFHERIKNYTSRLHGTLPTDERMIAFGALLFEVLFQGDVRRLYDEARSRQRERKLDLVLTSMIPWIAEKPWEFCYDAARSSFLATEEIQFVRNVLTAIPAEPIALCQGPLRILVVSAQPIGFGRLSIEQEVGVIRRGFEPLIDAGLAVVDVLPRATPAAIHGALSAGQYTIVHFIGHGVFDEKKQEGCLVFEDTRGGAFYLGERSVREIFCQRGISLVFLNACQTGRGGRSDFNKGVAQALVAHGLPSLVANQYSVLDSSATSFAQHFYWSLANGMTLGESAREARIAVNYSLHGEPIDWAVPVVYARDADRSLCARPAARAAVPATTVRTTARRAIVDRTTRVAVWDIDYGFPALERTLETMNAAQRVYGFELVDMSAPLDIWDLEETGRSDATVYLWAERLAKRLQSKPAQLDVNLLTCVTRHWLRDDNWLNLYGWWPADRQPPVAIFSVAGFNGLAAEGPETDRAIANILVGALAGVFGELAAHERGAKDCPLSLNRDRAMAQLVGAQKFDAVCRRKLQQKAPGTVRALESLLEVFPS